MTKCVLSMHSADQLAHPRSLLSFLALLVDRLESEPGRNPGRHYFFFLYKAHSFRNQRRFTKYNGGPLPKPFLEPGFWNSNNNDEKDIAQGK